MRPSSFLPGHSSTGRSGRAKSRRGPRGTRRRLVRFWDTSGVVPLLLQQEASDVVRPLLESDPMIAAWWGTPVECASAAARLRREGLLTVDEEVQVLALLEDLEGAWFEIRPSEPLRREAGRLLRTHSLKAADALQLAAAITWAGPDRKSEIVTLDERLALAAQLEGFTVLPGPAGLTEDRPPLP
ncbi:MAG: PIN domain-containing protein [Gemmatimonadales bacterium]|nr:MAG: PIN domain-containing protein [Gemmatimonadales bacterium]